MEPNTKQKEVIKSIKENRITLVEAPPGTGKTYTAVYAAMEYVKENIKCDSNFHRKVLILTFSKNARAQIEKQLLNLDDGRVNYEKYIDISNYHSFYQKYIWAYSMYLGMQSNLKITPPLERKILISNFLKEKGIESPTDAQIGWTSDLLEGDFRPTNTRTKAYREVQQVVGFKDDAIKYILNLNFNGEISFSDFGYHTKQLLVKSRSLLNMIRNKYKFIVLDEYQDSSDIQHYIVKKLLGDINKGLFFADSRQMIYGWRGAKSTRIKEITEYYDDEINVLELSEIHRYKDREDLINLVSRIRSGSYDRREFQETSNIKYIDIKVNVDQLNLFNPIVRSKCYYNLKYKILNEMKLHKGKTIGILCRTNDVVEYLREEFKVEFKKDLKELNNSEKEHDLLFYVYQFLCSCDYHNLDNLMKFVFYLTFAVCYEKEFGKVKKNKLNDITIDYILNVRNELVKKVRDIFTCIKNQDDLKEKLIFYLNFLWDSSLNINRNLISLILKLLKIKEIDYEKVNSLLLKHQYLNSYTVLKGEYVLNIHQSKGREFDVVFIVDSNSIKNDANLFYVATSRVKEKVVFFNWNI